MPVFWYWELSPQVGSFMSGGMFYSMDMHVGCECIWCVCRGCECVHACTHRWVEKRELGCEWQEHKDYLREILSQQAQGNSRLLRERFRNGHWKYKAGDFSGSWLRGICISWKGEFSSLTESSKLCSVTLNKENHFNWKLRFEFAAQAKRTLLWLVIWAKPLFKTHTHTEVKKQLDILKMLAILISV